MATVQDEVPDAVVNVKCDRNTSTIKIFVVEGGNPREICAVPQRDMYRKYNWPGRKVMAKALSPYA